MTYYKYKINIVLLNVLSIFLCIPLFAIVYFLNLFNSINLDFIFIYFIWMFLHEILHSVVFYFDKNINKKSIVYGACLEKGIMYCMCKDRVGKRIIMLSLLFPFLIIGIITFIFGLIFNNQLLQLLSLFNYVGAIGDLVMFFSFLRLPDFNYIDLDDCDSFVLESSYDLSKYNLFCLDLISTSDSIVMSNNYKKVNVTKLSLAFFLLILLILVVKILSSFLI